MAKYEKRVRGDFDTILKNVNEDITSSGISINLVDKSYYENSNVKIAVLVYDKYFMRNGNRASLSVTIVGNDEDVFITAIGAGGGSGVFLNFSLGAEEKLVEVVEQSISRMRLS